MLEGGIGEPVFPLAPEPAQAARKPAQKNSPLTPRLNDPCQHSGLLGGIWRNGTAPCHSGSMGLSAFKSHLDLRNLECCGGLQSRPTISILDFEAVRWMDQVIAGRPEADLCGCPIEPCMSQYGFLANSPNVQPGPVDDLLLTEKAAEALKDRNEGLLLLVSQWTLVYTSCWKPNRRT